MINMEEKKQRQTQQPCEELYGKKISLFNHGNPKYSILHIDDDETLLSVSKLFFEELAPSFEVNTTSDTSNMYNLLDKEFDCIVVDYSMPPNNGLDVCKRIREIKNTPIILFTGQDEDNLPLSDFETLNVQYFQKSMDPCNYHKLIKTILTLVNQNLDERKQLLLKAVD